MLYFVYMPEIDSNKIKSISLVIPLFNESKRISRTLPSIKEYLDEIERNYQITCELVLVDDGSTDSTMDVVKALPQFHNTQSLILPQNAGKGFALKTGFERATGNYIFFMDADLSIPLSHIGMFMELAEPDLILLGSRKIQSGLIKNPQPLSRRILGNGFIMLNNLLFGMHYRDFACGFKMFPREIGKRIFKKLTISRWSFDVEVLYLAKKFGYRTKEVPVEWYNDADSKVRLRRDVIGSFIEVIKIRVNSFTGVYESRTRLP